MSMTSCSLACIQCAYPGSITSSVEHHIRLIRAAANEGAQVIVLQELFQQPYVGARVDETHFSDASAVDGALIQQMSALSKELAIWLVVPFFEQAGPGVYYNAAVVLDDQGERVLHYRKNHIPEDPGFHEKYYFAPGDLGYPVVDTPWGKLGVLICWDQWFPEAARVLALQGAQLVVYPTAIGSLETESKTEMAAFHDAWQTIQRSHAIANGVFVAAVNRVGVESGTTFWGHSFVAGPFGEILAEAGEKEEILHATLDLSEVETVRKTWPFFRDRRIDTYAPLLKRWTQ
ncbi:MAG: acyltransferase [Rhodothermaeota bacterium MED-G64]|nr:MAG: acyltransferase [Rhodothermaeota bacterium MED-G64]